MLHENKLMSEGVDYNKAIEVADIVELKERQKSLLFKESNNLKKVNIGGVIKKIHIRQIKKYSKNIQVWIVNGELIRDLFCIDFTEGGHDKVYRFIPKNEIWIDNDILRAEFRYVLLHEMHERILMSKGLDYHSAHIDSSHIEFYCRHHPKELPVKLKQEIDNTKVLEIIKH